MQSIDKVVAIVDNDVVMQSQLDARLREVQQTIDKRGGALPPDNVLSQQVLERLIIENIQLQIGDRSGIRITDEELNQALASIAQRFKVKVADIVKWNNIKTNKYLQPGQELTLYLVS